MTFIPLDWQENTRYRSEEVRAAMGKLPLYINAGSTDEIYRQIDANSASGWHPHDHKMSWELFADESLRAPGLPPVMPLASAYHLGEKALVFPAGWLCVVQLSGKYSIARVL